MPIVTIEVLDDNPPTAVASGRLQALGDALGELFGSEPGGTWVQLQRLPRSAYVENRVTVPSSVRPTMVHVLKADLEEGAALAAEARAISTLVSQHLERPAENVHVLYAPRARGRIAFGGELVS